MAQTIAEYTFSTTTDGTLEDMTGSTALLTAGTYYDDTASPVTNIGFTFGFGLGAYTQFSANSNGQMQLGPTAISGGSATPAANLPRLAPLSGDNAIRATGLLHYLVTGSEPNRKLVVEWLDLRVPYSTATETGTYGRMQAWLFEGSNNIKFVYGTMWNMATYASTRGVYVSTSNVAGSVGNVTDIINTMTWTNTGTSVVTTSFPASSAMANLNSPNVGERRVFHINYPVYTTPPNPAVLLSPANNGWAFTDATLNWAGGGGGATSYDVYFGTSSTPPFVVNQGATSYTPTLAAGTTYYWNIVARNEFGPAAATDTWSFKTPTATQLAESFEVAVPPAGWANPGAWTRSTSTYNHGLASAYKYPYDALLYILSTPKVTISGTSVLSFMSYCSTTSTSATWDVVYSPDRVTWTQVPGSTFTHPTASVWVQRQIDLSSLAGNNYYLGIRAGGYSYASYYIDKVIGPEVTPEAPGPVTLTAPADLATDVNERPTFTWTASTTGGVPTGYRVLCDTNPTPTTVIGTVTGLTYTPTNPLAYSTPYYWTVEAYNGTGSATTPTPRSFTTGPNPTVTTFDPPFFEGFESVTVPQIPYGWTVIDNNADGDKWVSTTTNPRTGTKCATIYTDYNTVNDDYLVTPPLVLSNNQELKFWTRAHSVGEFDEISVLLSTTTPSASAFTTVLMPTTVVNYLTYTEYSVNLSAYSGTVYLSFARKNAPADGWYLYIDDVTIRDIPAAPIFGVSPTSWDFGQVELNVPATKIFTITNTGGGTLDLTSVDVTAGNAYYTISVAPADLSLGAGESTPFTVRYLPTTAEAHEGTVTIVHSLGTTTVDLDGLGYTRPAGSTVENPYPVTLPLVGFTGDTSLYGDDYESTWVTPNSSYIGGDDMVLQFTLAVPSTVSGTLSATDGGTWVGMIIVNTAPNLAVPAPVLGSGTSSGSTATMAGTILQAGTYYLIISTWPTPQSFQFSLDFNAVALTAPGPVALTAPVENAVGVALLPTFTWTAPTTGSAPTGYRVYCDENADPTTLLNTVTGLTYTATTSLVYNTLYYWKVVAFNGVGDAEGNPVQSFTSMVDPANEPTAPLLLTPAEAAVMPIAGFNFTWGINGTGGNPTGYTLYVSDTDDETDFWNTEYYYELGAAVTSYDPTQDVTNPITYTYGGHYFWSVSANNGEHQWPPREFVIEPDPNITVFPYIQTFEGTTFPPALWTLATTGTYAWTRSATVNGYGTTVGVGSARANFYSQSGTTPYDLITAPIDLAGQGGLLGFDHAYATYAGENDQLEIMISNDAGATYNSLMIYDGGAAGPLNTGGIQTGTFVPTLDQWATKSLNLPPGTNRVKFRAISAFGNDLYVDNITVDQRILPPNDVAVLSISDLPAGQLVETTYTPKATVINNGLNTQTFNVTMTFTGYSSTQTVTGLVSGATSLVTFANWTPSAAGSFTATVEAVLTGDSIPLDNIKTSSFNVWASLWENKAATTFNAYLGSASNWIDGSGNGHVITVGGNTTSVLNNEVSDYNANLDTWTVMPVIPAGLRVHTSATVGNNVYVIAGSDASSVYQSAVYKYDLTTGTGGTWATMASLPVALGWVKAAAYQNYIYVAGGVDAVSTVVNTVYVYNTTTDTWATATPLPAAVFGGAFAISGNKLVYVAGADISVISNLVYVGTINPSTPTEIVWQTSTARYPGLPAVSKPSSGNLMAQTAKKMLKDGNNFDLRVVSYPAGTMYRFDGATWGTDAIIVAGGSPTADWAAADPGVAYTYNPTTDTWMQIAPLNVPVYGAYTSAVQTSPTTWKAVVASGGPASTTTQVYTAVLTALPPAAPVVTIAANGTLIWAAVTGATSYKIYSADDPYGTFNLVDTLVGNANTSWLDPSYPQAKKFYKVMANN